MIIQTVSGHETFPGSDMRVGLFHRANPQDEGTPLHDAAKKYGGGVSSIGTPNFVQASESNRNHGIWAMGRYAVAEKSFLCVLISKKLPGNFIKYNKQLMLYNRPGAALRRVIIPFSKHPMAVVDQGIIEGNFDIMTIDQMVEFGFDFTEAVWRQFMFEDEQASEFYTMDIIEAEREPIVADHREAVVTEKGNTVRIATPRRRVNVPGT